MDYMVNLIHYFIGLEIWQHNMSRLHSPSLISYLHNWTKCWCMLSLLRRKEGGHGHPDAQVNQQYKTFGVGEVNLRKYQIWVEERIPSCFAICCGYMKFHYFWKTLSVSFYIKKEKVMPIECLINTWRHLNDVHVKHGMSDQSQLSQACVILNELKSNYMSSWACNSIGIFIFPS